MKTAWSRTVSAFHALFLTALLIGLAVYGRAQNHAAKGIAEAASQSWFTVKQIADGVWRIDDHGGDNMYLVTGTEKALLIDAGTGVADLSARVRSITTLPLIVVNTHGHPDHSGSDYQFRDVCAHPADFDAIKYFCSESFHKRAVERTSQNSPELAHLLAGHEESVAAPTLVPVHEGSVFALGERELEVIEVPGHTPGSICLIDANRKLLFTGDNDNTLSWLFLDGCRPLEVYLESLHHLKERSGDFDTLFPGHGDPLDSAFLDEQIICVQNILSGECRGERYTSFAGNGMVCAYKRARIAFNPDNLRVQPGKP